MFEKRTEIYGSTHFTPVSIFKTALIHKRHKQISFAHYDVLVV